MTCMNVMKSENLNNKKFSYVRHAIAFANDTVTAMKNTFPIHRICIVLLILINNANNSMD